MKNTKLPSVVGEIGNFANDERCFERLITRANAVFGNLGGGRPITKVAADLAGASAEYAQIIGKMHSESGENEESCDRQGVL